MKRMFRIERDATFGGIPMGQTWSALYVLEKVLREYKPDLIIELGTAYGPLSLFFSLFAPTHTFDTKDIAIKRPNITYYQKDV